MTLPRRPTPRRTPDLYLDVLRYLDHVLTEESAARLEGKRIIKRSVEYREGEAMGMSFVRFVVAHALKGISHADPYTAFLKDFERAFPSIPQAE